MYINLSSPQIQSKHIAAANPHPQSLYHRRPVRPGVSRYPVRNRHVTWLPWAPHQRAGTRARHRATWRHHGYAGCGVGGSHPRLRGALSVAHHSRNLVAHADVIQRLAGGGARAGKGDRDRGDPCCCGIAASRRGRLVRAVGRNRTAGLVPGRCGGCRGSAQRDGRCRKGVERAEPKRQGGRTWGEGG